MQPLLFNKILHYFTTNLSFVPGCNVTQGKKQKHAYVEPQELMRRKQFFVNNVMNIYKLYLASYFDLI